MPTSVANLVIAVPSVFSKKAETYDRPALCQSEVLSGPGLVARGDPAQFFKEAIADGSQLLSRLRARPRPNCRVLRSRGTDTRSDGLPDAVQHPFGADPELSVPTVRAGAGRIG